MNIFWIIVCGVIFFLLLLEPIGYLLIRKTIVIYATDSRRLQHHSGDSITKIYLIEDDDDNIYLSDYDVPLFADIEVECRGFNLPKFGMVQRITEVNRIIEK